MGLFLSSYGDISFCLYFEDLWVTKSVYDKKGEV
jgi:hypothetical protein